MTSTFASWPKANDTHRKWLAPCGTIGGHNNRQTNHLQNFVTPGPPSPGQQISRQRDPLLPHFTRTGVPPPYNTPFHTTSVLVPGSSPARLSTASVSSSTTLNNQSSLASAPWCQPVRHGSATPYLDGCPRLSTVGRFRYCDCLAVGSAVCAGYAYPLAWFPGEKIPKNLRYYTNNINTY